MRIKIISFLAGLALLFPLTSCVTNSSVLAVDSVTVSFAPIEASFLGLPDTNSESSIVVGEVTLLTPDGSEVTSRIPILHWLNRSSPIATL